MPESAFAVPDPRSFPAAESAPAPARELYALAEASLEAQTRQRSDAIDAELRAALAGYLRGEGAALAAAFAGAPSVALTRHLWRALDALWRESPSADAGTLAVTVFALPLVIVTGIEDAGEAGVLSGVLPHPEKLASILRDAGALGGNRTFTMANVVVGADAIDLSRLPELRMWQAVPDALAPDATWPVRTLLPAPIAVEAAREAVHLRFLVGTAIAKSGADLIKDIEVRGWGAPFARELTRELGHDGVSVLALPRAPRHLLPALSTGRAAQREVSAQIFASNAIRKFRGAVGEPSAVISAHRAADACGGGELRLSLSSPFDPRAAEGFRCPLYPLDRVSDVVTMLVDLLRDCRVTDIRAVGGVHADRVPQSGLPLLFKPDTIPDIAVVALHLMRKLTANDKPAERERITLAEAAAMLPTPDGKRSAAVFEHGTLQVKLYAPRGTDPQQPHTRDEAYVVARGGGWFVNGAHRHPIDVNDVLFVKAAVVHRFEDFTDDFLVWVFFYGPEGGEDDSHAKG